MYPHAQAQCGALGMTGNTCEWCMNKVDAPHQWQIDASGDKRVLRGGSYLDDYDMGQVDFRFGDDTPDVISGLNGFRLVIAPR
jgi:formylglycine-generating enzyme required for sulfatase activity